MLNKVKVKVLIAQSSQLFEPTRLLCSWDIPGKNAGVHCQSPLQAIFPTQGLNPGLLHCRPDCLPSEPPKRQRERQKYKNFIHIKFKNMKNYTV